MPRQRLLPVLRPNRADLCAQVDEWVRVYVQTDRAVRGLAEFPGLLLWYSPFFSMGVRERAVFPGVL